MKKPVNNMDIDDDDIAEVFKAQTIAAPNDLRQSILEQATVEAKVPVNTQSFKTTGAKGTGTFAGGRSAMAAAILVVVIAVPLTFDLSDNQSESLLEISEDESRGATVATAPEASPTTQDLPQESLTPSAPSTARMLTPSAAAREMTADAVLETESISVQTDEDDSTAGIASRSARLNNLSTDMTQTKGWKQINQEDASPSFGVDAGDDAPPIPSYRKTADAWINEIKFLIADGQAAKAKEEYALYALQYPEQAKQYTPDFSRRFIDIPDQDPDQDPYPRR